MSDPEQPKIKLQVFVVSDATGVTAERVIRAVLVQFEDQIEAVIHRRGCVASIPQLSAVLDEAEARRGLVIYSLVDQSLRSWIETHRPGRDIEVIDLLGPIMEKMTRMFHVMPVMHPGLLGLRLEESMQLAESIDYTLKHDDGQKVETLDQADIIIPGVSRSSKTPTSLYLSCHYNLKVANVPLVPGVNPPEEIFALKRPLKVGLVISPEKLSILRKARYETVPVKDYVDLQAIRRELDHCREIFSHIANLRLIEVTNISIEETAKRIIKER